MRDYLLENDGVDHINIYSKGQTELGRMMSNFYECSIELEYIGCFRSIEGLYFWLKAYFNFEEMPSEYEELRGLYGFKAKKLGTELTEGLEMSEGQLREFRNLIYTGLQKKVLSNLELMTALEKSRLPFDHYYVKNIDGKAISTKPKNEMVQWVAIWEDIRVDLQFGLEPYYTKEL